MISATWTAALVADHAAERQFWMRRTAPAGLDQGGRRVVRRHKVQRVAVQSEDIAVFGVANAGGVGQHLAEGRLQIARRAADDLQHLRGGGLLLRGLVEFAGEAGDLGFLAGARRAATVRHRRFVAVLWRCRLALSRLGFLAAFRLPSHAAPRGLKDKAS